MRTKLVTLAVLLAIQMTLAGCVFVERRGHGYLPPPHHDHG
jgi:predicted small lipoprotein YifL